MTALFYPARLALFIAACEVLGAQTAPSFRLPAVAQPKQESLDITIVPAAAEFHGEATILVALKQAVDTLWLNAKDLAIEHVALQTATGARNLQWVVNGEFLGLELNGAAGPGQATIYIRYSGRLDDKTNSGVYRKRFGNDWYVFTTFTPIEARRAFPCFDEPAYKAEWRLTLHVPRGDVAVANSPARAESEEPDGMKKIVFEPTPPLASEVVAFAVGPFDVVDAGLAGAKQIPVRIITPRGRADEADAARTATADILAKLEQYMKIPYPWAKLDHLAAIDQSFGAVENPGLITYRARVLLAPPETDTFERQRAMRSTMAHELAHQWFGNLVTQAWWDDVWLSEAFATWLGGKIADQELPPFERGLAAANRRHAMLLADRSERVRPVRLAMHSRADMKDVYNGLVYQKGAALLSMIEYWLGADEFRAALHRYITEHEYSTATTADLARAIREATKIDATAVLDNFLDRPHAPAFRFTTACTNGACELTIDQGSTLWTAPVCWHTQGSVRRCEVISAKHSVRLLTGGPGWIWTNATGVGYYRSVLEGSMFVDLVNKGYSELTGPERAALAGDLVAAGIDGTVNARDILLSLPRIARDGEPAVAMHAGAIMLQFALAAPASIRKQYADWLRDRTHFLPAAPEQGRALDDFFRDK